MNIEYKIIECIFDIASANDMSMYELAHLADISQSTLSNFKKRGNLPTLSTLIKICQAFNLKLSDFFIYVENNKSEEMNL